MFDLLVVMLVVVRVGSCLFGPKYFFYSKTWMVCTDNAVMVGENGCLLNRIVLW